MDQADQDQDDEPSRSRAAPVVSLVAAGSCQVRRLVLAQLW